MREFRRTLRWKRHAPRQTIANVAVLLAAIVLIGLILLVVTSGEFHH